MPLVALGLGAYVAGLLCGFADETGAGLFVAIAVLAGAAMARRPVWAATALFAGAGAVVAHAAQSADASCLRNAVQAHPLIVVLDDPAAPGAFVHGRVDPCRAPVSLAVEYGVAEAGSTVEATGQTVKASRGLLIQHARIARRRPAGMLNRWRATAGAGIDSTFHGDAAMARALLIADTRGLSPEVRDRFAVAGLAHILSISGLHVGLIAVGLDLVLVLLGATRRAAAILSLVVITLYVATIGLPAPAVRAAAMLGVATLSRLGQRPTSPWAVLAMGGAEPLVDPSVAIEVGYQLSMIGVAALIAGSALVDRLALDRLPRWARSVVGAMVGTTVATIASAPLLAWVFGRVSLIAPVSNLFAAPLIALAQPMLFCGMVLAPLRPVAALIADAAHPLLAGLDRVALASAAVPGAALQVSPTPIDAVLAATACAAVLVACGSRDRPGAALVALLTSGVLIWRPLVPTPSGLVELHVIDVGQGDAIALRTSHGRWVLFDAGRAWEGGDAGRTTILPYLGRRGGELEMFVLSHPHTDHVGGAATVLRALRPKRYVDAGFPGGASAYRGSLDAARAAGVVWTRAHPNDSVAIDGVTITFLAPDSAWTSTLVDPNLASVVSLVRVGDIRMLLTGDAEAPEEEWLLAHAANRLHADVLKVAHHGSSTSSIPSFLAAVRPRLAIVSVGAGNTYGHPSSEVLRTIAASSAEREGAQVLRTDKLGTIVASTDGHRVFVEAGGTQWELSRAVAPHSDTSSPR